ncbi:MAG TPA: response regulator [Ktedonobacterales bacterium]
MTTPMRHGAAQAESHLSPRILVVDDDQDIRETLRLALEDEGYEVEEAEDGVEALLLMRDSAGPLVVILDFRMPRLNGLSVLRHVNTAKSPAVHHNFVLVTANRAMLSTTGLKLLQRMDVPIVEKPFDLNDLLDLVTRAADALSQQAE